jgi:hypothetical protein
MNAKTFRGYDMNVYQIALPDTTNSVWGASFFNAHAHINIAAGRREWATRALQAAGGFTYLGERRGAWMDDEGRVYDETMHWYEVACARDTWDALVLYAFQLFPDQKAIYTARVGECEIIDRPPVDGGE